MFHNTKHAETTTPVIMWFVSIAAAIIIIVWYAQSAQFTGVDLSAVDEDLKNLHYDLSLGCQNEEVQTTVQIRSQQATLIYEPQQICIKAFFTDGDVIRCLPTPCDIGISGNISLVDNHAIRIHKTTQGGDDIFDIGGVA